MDLKARLKHLTKGMAGSKNLEEGIESGTISDKDADFVWNTLNLVALIEIKDVLEHEIQAYTEVVMQCMENKDEFEHTLPLLNNFLDILNIIKEKVDNSSAGNITLGL